MQWYVKEFSALTKVSVPTLHHYDAIGLLKPSLRLENGYRVYSEGDLFKLERIVALKFFGFSLEKIKALVGNDEEALSHLKRQMRFLDEQIKQLHQARYMADTIVTAIDTHATIDWPQVVSLIKVYQMTKELRDSWAAEVYTEKELEQLAEVQHRFAKETKDFQALWAKLFAETEENLTKKPDSAIGKKLGLQYILLKNQLKEAYKKYPALWDKIWRVYEEGKVPDRIFLGSRTAYAWLEQAAKIWAKTTKDSL